jgi:RNA polymerase sigma factor (sigma-70 family)
MNGNFIMKQEKDLNIPLYLDLYGDFLTEKQARAVELYYNDDLSLAEIAQEYGISRQGVSDILSRARKKLYNMEEKLLLVRQEMEKKNGI